MVGEGGFRAVLAHFSIDELNDLQEAQLLRVSILREVLAVHRLKSGRRRFDFITDEKWAGSQPARARSPEEIVRESLAAIGLAPGKARRSALRFLRSGAVQSVNEGVDHEKGISELSRRDAFDQPYMREVAEAVLVSLDYPFRNRPWRFVVHPVESGFEIDTDLDFDSLSRTVSAMRREKVHFTPAHLVDVVQDVRFIFIVLRCIPQQSRGPKSQLRSRGFAWLGVFKSQSDRSLSRSQTFKPSRSKVGALARHLGLAGREYASCWSC